LTTETFIYEGEDLDAMDLADNYHGWILDRFEPALGTNVVEVGAGTGSFSRLIARRAVPERLLLLEPSDAMASKLVEVAGEITEAEVTTKVGFLSDSSAEVTDFAPDTFVYVNVLEHVEDDAGEIQRVFDLLPPGGTLCAFVPALPFLYSKFDKSIDHYRRYTLQDLSDKCTAAGFEIVERRYFDILGILPWLIKFKILGSTKLDPGAVGMYDRFIVPVMRRLEALVRVPVGKNVLVLACKPSAVVAGRDAETNNIGQ
jgi:SAM-dependent methyltransferase